MEHKLEEALGVSRVVRRGNRRQLDEQWDSLNPPNCPKCGKETLRIIDGVCAECGRRKNELNDRALETRELLKPQRRFLGRSARRRLGL